MTVMETMTEAQPFLFDELDEAVDGSKKPAVVKFKRKLSLAFRAVNRKRYSRYKKYVREGHLEDIHPQKFHVNLKTQQVRNKNESSHFYMH
jgi:hypothetical protein